MEPGSEALRQALDAARQARKEHFESISGGYVAYISSTSAATLDESRRTRPSA